MTYKQIIIDGVDVSGCKYFNGYQRIVRNNECIVDMQNACIEEIKTKPCSQKHNCYFKNWQRKEQECEELKKQYNCYACDTCKGKEDYINLKRHCENAIKSLHSKQAELDQLKAENEELKKQLESTKGLVTIGNKQLAEAFKKNEELEKLYKANKNCFEKTEKLLDESEQERMKLKQTLAEIKPILEYYENSKIGEKQEDGSYKLEFTFSDIETPYCIKYDPKPAREALRKINECEGDNEV